MKDQLPVDDIAAELIDTMPDVSEHAIAEHAEQQRENHANESSDTDTVKPAAATDKKPPRSRAKKSSVARKTKQQLADEEAALKNAAATQTGATCAGLFIMLATAIGGADFVPRVDEHTNESDMLTNAFSDYCRDKEIGDVPAGVALCLALALYTVPRFQMPKTRSRITVAWDYITGRYASWKLRRIEKRAKREAR